MKFKFMAIAVLLVFAAHVNASSASATEEFSRVLRNSGVAANDGQSRVVALNITFMNGNSAFDAAWLLPKVKLTIKPTSVKSTWEYVEVSPSQKTYGLRTPVYLNSSSNPTIEARIPNAKILQDKIMIPISLPLGSDDPLDDHFDEGVDGNIYLVSSDLFKEGTMVDGIAYLVFRMIGGGPLNGDGRPSFVTFALYPQSEKETKAQIMQPPSKAFFSVSIPCALSKQTSAKEKSGQSCLWQN